MTVKDLRKALNDYPDDMEVLTKKTELLGNVAFVNSVKEDSYGFFGMDMPCVLLTDEYKAESEHKRTIDADELLKRIAEKCKIPSLSKDTVNGLCGATVIIYDMLNESGKEQE